jgi:hypothetical protein
MREQFRDGAGLLATYQFAVNHSEEQGRDFNRSIERTAVTTGPKFVLQQGESAAGVLSFTGTFFTQAQHDAIKAYYDACANRTVFFTDFTGTEYEVVVTRFNPVRHRTIRNPRDLSLLHYWTYTLEMEVIA